MVAATFEATKIACAKVNQLATVTNRQSEILKVLAYKQIDLEARSRRNNLVLWGCVERPSENCFQIIRELINTNLGLDADNMYLVRAHRLGPWKSNIRVQKRPIIVNFRDYCDLELVLSKAYMFKNTQYSVDRDLPKEISEARKRLWPRFKSLKNANPSAKVRILYPAKLLCDRTVIQDEFPEWYSVLAKSRLCDFPNVDVDITPELTPSTDFASQSQSRDINFMGQTVVSQARVFDSAQSRDIVMNDKVMNEQVNSDASLIHSSQQGSQADADLKNRNNEKQSSSGDNCNLTSENNIGTGKTVTHKSSIFKPYDSRPASEATNLCSGSDQSLQTNEHQLRGHVSRSMTRESENRRRVQSADMRLSQGRAASCDRVASRDRRFNLFQQNRPINGGGGRRGAGSTQDTKS